MYASLARALDATAGTLRNYHERAKHIEAQPFANRRVLDWA